MNPEIIHHMPAFKETIIDWLALQDHHCIVDGTCGEGGHASVIVPMLKSPGMYIALDRDEQILKRAQHRMAPYKDMIRFFHSSYDELGNVLQILKIQQVDRILLDLGLSMYHLKESERGFSFTSDDLLDMRFDPSVSPISAMDVINHFHENEISDILYLFGEEHKARKIARKIVESRKVKAIMTCSDLARVIAEGTGRTNKRHPATRSFQALRIYVNAELSHLEQFLSHAHQWVHPGGYVALITYHSLEDRIVKRFALNSSCFRMRDKKPILPDENEISANPAVRSAKLRILVRC